MEHIQQCPICQARQLELSFTAEDYTVSHERFTVQRCQACGFRFTSPRPDQSSIGKYYLSASYISHAGQASGFKDRVYHYVRKRAIKNKHALIARYHSSGRLLDVGCGTGDFLAYMQTQHFQVQGVEVSSAARGFAQAKGVKVQPELAAIPITPAFDVITLWHVLEHVPDPMEALREIYARLSPGGLLVVAVPDNESWDCRHYGSTWAAWDVPRHLSHFRQNDIVRMFKEIGFEPLPVHNMWFDAPYVSMLSEQYNGAGTLSSFIKGTVLGLWSNAVALFTGGPTSSSLNLAKKPS
ncbi:MAG: class I SAM-dependent methyltransferase [Bacteroidetes bacterium]|nr:class I SAM-dependent methyltransferase [Bacteroidota bacterium]MBS1940462.1 class I SAM-dependent methyltransferase [Bacteroidota bacterium]